MNYVAKVNEVEKVECALSFVLSELNSKRNEADILKYELKRYAEADEFENVKRCSDKLEKMKCEIQSWQEIIGIFNHIGCVNFSEK